MTDEPVALRRWLIGDVGNEIDGLSGIVALTEHELLRGRYSAAQTVSLADVMATPVPRAPEVVISLPTYRGKEFVRVLAWVVVERLAKPGAQVTWLTTKSQGPESILKLLTRDGWNLNKVREGRIIRLCGPVPGTSIHPIPRVFNADLGERKGVQLFADYGVFSPGRVDDGTALLLEVALRHPVVTRVADIGVGYGTLAVGLTLNGVAKTAIGTDTDAIALWLAAHNAQVNNVALDLKLTSDPASVEHTPLTVCNVPTHISREKTALFMTALAKRAHRGTLLIVIHASLEQRYRRYLADFSHIREHCGPSHVVLEVGNITHPLDT